MVCVCVNMVWCMYAFCVHESMHVCSLCVCECDMCVFVCVVCEFLCMVCVYASMIWVCMLDVGHVYGVGYICVCMYAFCTLVAPTEP